MRILIADDDPVSRTLLHATLTKWGYETVVCCDGREALSHLETGVPPEIAILDWMMPELDGPEVCRRVRLHPRGAALYIVLLTAKTGREDMIAGLQAGADDYITKPFHEGELYSRLQAGLRVTSLQRRLADRARELEIALMRLRHTQQAQRLEALGRLASGVVHEISAPIQDIGGSLRCLQDSWRSIHGAIDSTKLQQGTDLDYVAREVPRAIEQSLEAIQRVNEIVGAIRDFSQSNVNAKTPTDLNRAIEKTITVTTNEWKYVAVLETDLDPKLPPVACFPGELQQVILNLIVNAAHAVAEVTKRSGDKGTIRIETSNRGESVEIRISDTGACIPEEHGRRIFEPFFTTTEAGRGTGQSLAVAQSVVQQHNGKIWFETGAGWGTIFIIHLPIDGNSPAALVNRRDERRAPALTGRAPQAVLPERAAFTAWDRLEPAPYGG